MERRSPWPTVLGTAALLALPLLAAAQTGSAGSQASQKPQTGSAAGEAAQTQSPQTPPPATTNPQADAAAARQHLTEARQSLADMTALPQAQQLQGEARTQVSQLISQFNQLITAEADWRSSYEQVNSTLTTLLNSPSSAVDASSSTTGAVGTSGSAGGAATIDPAIRTKLEEFRTHLQAFYTAAGGDAANAADSDSTTSMRNAAPDDVESHIAAIERILDQAGAGAGASSGSTGSTGSSSSTVGTSGSTSAASVSGGGVTLTPQQIDQIRAHLQQLRSSIKK